MKLLFVSILGLAATTGAFAQQGPGRGEVFIDGITVNGSGCPIGTAGASVINNSSRTVDSFQVVFDRFIVEKPGKSRKFCNVLLNIKYPAGWSYTVLGVSTDGYAEIQRGVKGTFKMSYTYRNSNRGSSKTRSQQGYWEGDYQFSDRFAHPVYSECGKVYPLNLKTELKLTGSSNHGQSILTVDRQSGLLRQVYNLRWKRC